MTNLTAVTGARIFDGSAWLDDYAVLVEGQKVCKTVPTSTLPGDTRVLDYTGHLIVPGFIDLQWIDGRRVARS